ncbi:MAG: aminopeptidase [Thermodesulfobacteriota bacterium]
MREELTKAIAGLYVINLGIKKNEKVLVFTDTIGLDEDVPDQDKKRRKELVSLAEKVAEIGKEFCDTIFLTYSSLKEHGAEPPRKVWSTAFGKEVISRLEEEGLLRRILEKKLTTNLSKRVEGIIKGHKNEARVNVVIALSNFSTTHTMFREFLCSVCGVRYASMPLFDKTMFFGPMRVNWEQLARRTETLAEVLGDGNELLVNAPNGTNLKIKMKGRPILADTGSLVKPGVFSNLPAGEVFFAPLEGKAEGRLVLEWAPTRKLNSPITLIIKNGLAVRVLGKEPYASLLRRVLKGNIKFRNIAELGIGTNDRAKRPDNILESEKILGTIHVALGDNSTFGGNVKAPFHQDFVVFDPTVVLLKGRKRIDILKDSRLLV